MGDRINKDKSYQEIENFNYHFLIPKFAKVRYLFTKEALIAIVMPVGIGFMLFFALASLIQLSVEHFSEDKLTVFSTYRYYTTGIFYIFLSIAVQWTSIDIHFINILNEVKWKGLSETLGKVNKSVEEFRKKNSP
ncbi:MAG: hypothetical protein P4L35_03660 [Ignavibacteriaceae bacterium]|nr:hypothetical protein [Ignavibacteriaceae bacterium]